MDWAKQYLQEIFLNVLKKVEMKILFDKVEPVLEKVKESPYLVGNNKKSKIHIVAIGKAALSMSYEAIKRCDFNVVSGIISTPEPYKFVPKGLQVFQGGHPLPNKQSLQAADFALPFLTNTRENDVVLFLISGGGSAAMEGLISNEIPLKDLQLFYNILITCGANIVEINTIRKHFSSIKGGRLALAAYPSKQITLYVSDVPEGNDSCVASGPTMPDETTVNDMYNVIKQYKLEKGLPGSIAHLLCSRQIPETPKHTHHAFQHSEWHCIVSNIDALKITKRYCEQRGWKCVIDTKADELPVIEASRYLLKRLNDLKVSNKEKPVCIVAGGEVRVSVTGKGKGGRNQAFVLECIEKISEKRIAILSAGTDGIDGNSVAAGAFADGNSFKRANDLNLDISKYISNSDSNTFFSKLGDDIVTGETGNNIRDIRILLYL